MRTGHHPKVHAALTPEKPACIDGLSGRITTYFELDAASNRMAHLFRSLGLARGDGIAIVCQNSAEYMQVIWGAQRAGLYFTPVSWHLKAREIAHIVNNSGSKAFIASARFAEEAEKSTARFEAPVQCFSLFGTIEGFAPLEDAAADLPEHPIDDESSGIDMLYTSGTTGLPKGVQFPLHERPIDEVDDLELMFRDIGYVEGAVCMALGPMYHPSALYTGMLTQRYGGTWVLVDKFDAEQTLEIIERYRVNQLAAVPTHFVRLLKLPEDVRRNHDLSSLNCVLHTAAPCPVEVKRAMIEWLGPKIFEYYGGTEKVGGTSITSQEWLDHPGSIGKAVLGGVHVLDESDWSEKGPHEIGVLYFETHIDFEYHNDAEKTRSVFSPQGWQTLGDLGYVDEDGYIYLTDRKSNMIISGGVNVYPQEAENRLIAHEKVLDVAVFGIPDDDMGEQVKAVVELVDRSDACPELEAELIALCKEELASLKCPRSIDFIDRIPREANGKLYKRKLQETYSAKGVRAHATT